MELIFAVRGHKMWLDEFIKQLQGKYLPMTLKMNEQGQIDKNGKDTIMNFQVGVKPYEIYGVSFPKEHKDLMLNTILAGTTRQEKYSKFDKYLNWIRKLIGLQPIGEYDKSKILPIERSNLDIIGLGIKEDEQTDWGEGL